VEDIRHAIEQAGKYTIVNEPVNTAETWKYLSLLMAGRGSKTIQTFMFSVQ
jgi:hypothetical protein